MHTYYIKEGKFETKEVSTIPYRNFHRKDGPAIIWSDGDEEWFVNGKRHRLDGPAIDWKNLPKEYWINGKKLNTKEVKAWIKNNNINLKAKKGQSLFMLRFG